MTSINGEEWPQNKSWIVQTSDRSFTVTIFDPNRPKYPTYSPIQEQPAFTDTKQLIKEFKEWVKHKGLK